ncbi:alpha-L-fucosidase [Chitinophagaceae bacterium LB-8]|uniref:alpha-L-fucosidase n=1 Tax=Paraflavisolibacter caeni TaxID=2982496 RepID=A0A9X2XT11_9BACT|nr:alpha-L-fucosidase [Paraflavisolibacter caeni]MCU7547975.1 alpha-L-fucosidase [Paraflavisolibacter caeni]
MPISRRNILKSLAIGVPALQLNPALALSNTGTKVPTELLPIDKGQFEGTRASLRSYQIPDWFRDAKFGIWAHWGPQSAVEAGDWYARNMYIQGNKQYEHHVKTYGHPSKFGFKDTIPAWKAEKFDADYLLGLYKKAGAKYFMTMGVHHDNFDLWNSKHNRWNSVNMGPKKDIVGLFKKAAQKHGLKFGISDHLWVTYKWFSSSKGSDKDGPLAGVPYDGADPKNFDYYGRCEEVFNRKLDWDENGIPESWKRHWFDRIKDLVDQYEPDLLYCDGHMPFEEHGLSILAHLYNKSANKNGEKTQAVYTSKRPEDSAPGTGICVFDVERGVVESIWPQPWQTDTCIGDWHYNRERVGRYKSTKTVVDLLVDIVSRNGNLMLNFPLPASGMLDNDELTVLDGITKWMAVNSEGIYATRPWKIYGEGPQSQITKNEKEVNSAQQFNERNRKQFTHEDVRFTTKGKDLYAFFMGWPEGQQVVIRPLSTNSEQKVGRIDNVELLGHGKVQFTRDNEGLKVILPAQKPCENAYTLKVTGVDLI